MFENKRKLIRIINFFKMKKIVENQFFQNFGKINFGKYVIWWIVERPEVLK